MMRDRSRSNIHDLTPISRRFARSSDNLKETPLLNEWKWGLCGLILSIIVILAKIGYSNYDDIHKAVHEMKLIQYEVLTEEGEIMFKYAWKESVRYSKYWLPILCGFLATHFTWLIVYLDSNQPGVQPPSPFSPTKYKTQSGHYFHLNYVFAVLVGISVSAYMYWRGVSI